jgi:hypothetical protein
MEGIVTATREGKKIGMDEKIFPAVRTSTIEDVFIEVAAGVIDGSNGPLQIVYRNGFVTEPAGNVMPVDRPGNREPSSDELGYVSGH